MIKERFVKILIAALLTAFMAFPLAAQQNASGLPLRDAFECAPRAGLPNFFAKCEGKGPVKVAYLGGSITAQAGWRVYSLELLRKLYPQTEFVEVYAPIGGTGADIGAYRLGHDVIQHKPDLLFVEFATNGGSKNAMEGIVRNTWAALPDCDICFVYTVAGDTNQKLLENGKFGATASIFEDVAGHYEIPSIHMGVEAARLAKEGKLDWKEPNAKIEQVAGKELDKSSGIRVNADGRIPFSRDGAHPYLDTGHRLYADAIERSLPKLKEASGKAAPHVNPPAPLSDKYVRLATFLPLEAANLEGQWKTIESPAKTFDCADTEKFLPAVWEGAPDSTISFDFKGRGVMIYTIGGPSLETVEYSVDGKPAARWNSSDVYSFRWRLAPFFAARGLDPEKVHSFKLKVLEGQPTKGHGNVKPGNFTVGAICVEDGAIIGK